MKLTKENFPGILNQKIKDSGMTRVEFCEMVGIKRPTLDNWLYHKAPMGLIGTLNFFLNNKKRRSKK